MMAKGLESETLESLATQRGSYSVSHNLPVR